MTPEASNVYRIEGWEDICDKVSAIDMRTLLVSNMPLRAVFLYVFGENSIVLFGFDGVALACGYFQSLTVEQPYFAA